MLTANYSGNAIDEVVGRVMGPDTTGRGLVLAVKAKYDGVVDKTKVYFKPLAPIETGYIYQGRHGEPRIDMNAYWKRKEQQDEVQSK